MGISKNLIKYCLIGWIVIGIIICVLIRYNTIYSYSIDAPVEKDFSDSVNYKIEKVGKDTMSLVGPGTLVDGAGPGYYIVKGWAGIKGESVGLFDTKVALFDYTDNKCIVLSTEMEKREDLINYDNSDVSYENGGFVAKIKRKKLLKGHKYKVLLWYQNDENDFWIDTGEYLEVK